MRYFYGRRTCTMGSRRALTLLLAVLSFGVLSAQNVEWIWRLGQEAQGTFDQPFLLEPDGLGNVYGARTFGGTIDMNGNVLTGSRDIIVAKWNSAGEVLWARRVGGPIPMQLQDNDDVMDIAYDSANDELTVVGTYSSTLEFDHDTLLGGGLSNEVYMYVARYAPNGECLWARRGAGNYVHASNILVDPSASIVIFGTSSTGAILQGNPDVVVPGGGFIAEYSSNGDLLGVDNIIANGGIHGSLRLGSSDFVVSGTDIGSGEFFGVSIPASGAPSTSFLARTDLLGEVSWLVPFHSTIAATVSEAILIRPDRVVVTGIFYENLMLATDTLYSTPGNRNAFIACFSLSGDLIWLDQAVSPMWSTTGRGLGTTLDGMFYALCNFAGSLSMDGLTVAESTSNHCVLAKFDSTGVCRAAMDFGKIVGALGSISPTSEGIFFSCSYDSLCTVGTNAIDPPIAWSRSTFVAKIDSLVGFTGVQSLGEIGGGALHIYANPTNGLCTVDLPESLRISNGLVLSVFDNLGQLVQRAPLEFTDIGLRLDVRAQAKGVYHVELGDGIQRYTGTIVFE